MPDLAWAVFLWYNQDDKLEFEKVSEWDTMEEYDNVER